MSKFTFLKRNMKSIAGIDFRKKVVFRDPGFVTTVKDNFQVSSERKALDKRSKRFASIADHWTDVNTDRPDNLFDLG